MANILTFFRIIVSLAIPIGYWLVINFSKNFNEEKFFLFLLTLFIPVSYTHLTLPTNREV